MQTLRQIENWFDWRITVGTSTRTARAFLCPKFERIFLCVFFPKLCLWVGLWRTCVVGSQAELGAWDNERWAFSLDTYRPALPTQANIIARYRHLGSSHWDLPSEQRLELTWEKEEQGWEWAPVGIQGASPTSSPLSGKETCTKTHFSFSRIEGSFGVEAMFWSVACKGCIAFTTRLLRPLGAMVW